MVPDKNISTRIKTAIQKTEPLAKVIMFGSAARGEMHSESDIDLLILVNKDSLNRSQERNIKYNLYDIEFDSGQIISPLVFTEKEWREVHSITPLYKNIMKEGVLL